jgi:hypothetical protein
MTKLRWPCRWLAWIGLCWVLAAAERPTPQPDPIMESDQPDAPSKALKLPVLADGPGKGFHLYYEGKTYDGAMSELGDVRIRLKDNAGKPIGDWWVISPRSPSTRASRAT